MKRKPNAVVHKPGRLLCDPDAARFAAADSVSGVHYLPHSASHCRVRAAVFKDRPVFSVNCERRVSHGSAAVVLLKEENIGASATRQVRLWAPTRNQILRQLVESEK